MLFGHGDDGYRNGHRIVADFSTNVWWGGEPAGLKEYLWNRWPLINKYPEVVAESLAAKIALHHGLDPDQVMVTNGTTESIYLIAQAFRGRQTTIAIPTFSEYEDACRLHGHHVHFVNWDNLHPDMSVPPGLFFICQPNNPTGAAFPALETLTLNHPDTIFVIDEAFVDFTTGVTSLINRLQELSNVIILRSLTKAFAIPGLRLGYVAAPAALMHTLLLNKMPWTVNALAIEAGHFIFDHFSAVQIPLVQLLSARERFREQVTAMGMRTYPTKTHFFLAATPSGTAAELKAYLLQDHGLLIRDAANFRGLTSAHFRLATLSSNLNDLLITALQQWNKQWT